MATTRFFGRVCLPDAAATPTPLAPTEHLVLANAALAPDAVTLSAADRAAPTTLLVKAGASAGSPWIVLCTLSSSPTASQWGFGAGGLCFDAASDGCVTFKVVGPGTVHVSGHVATSSATSAAASAAASPAAALAPTGAATAGAAKASATSSTESKKRARPPETPAAAVAAPAASAADGKRGVTFGAPPPSAAATTTPGKAVADRAATPAAKKAPPPAGESEEEDGDEDEKDEGGEQKAEVGAEEKAPRKTKRQRKAEAKAAAKAAAEDGTDGRTGGYGPGAFKSEAAVGMGLPVAKPVVRHLGGGLTVKDTALGSGPCPALGRVVKILYEGLLSDGTVFDARQNKRSPLSFRLGLREVVPGMDKGMQGMKVGGSREIKVPAVMGYGSKRTGPIPPDSDLIFKVELIGLG